MQPAETATPARNYYLDWLRVIAILGVFIFHSQRFFDSYDWHVKNETTYATLNTVETIGGMWGMPLIFVISGASAYYSIRKNGAARFFKQRALRLLVPLAVSIFTLGALMVYLERISHHQYVGSFFSWLPRYFDGWFGYGGNFAWMGLHLWYLEALFIFSLLLLPVFAWTLQGSGRRVLAWLGSLLSTPGVIYLLALPVIVLLILIDPRGGILANHNFGGWSLPIYIFFFLNGFLLVSTQQLQESLHKLRWISLAGSLALLATLLKLVPGQALPSFGTSRYTLVMSLYGLDAWCGVLAILGFTMKRLTRQTLFLAYANEAVLPFYVIHQPVLLIIGFFIVQWPLSDLLKWAVIILASLVVILAIYEFAIRRVNPVRLLFGLKPMSAHPIMQPVKIYE